MISRSIRNLAVSAAALLTLAAMAPSAHADIVTVQNASFTSGSDGWQISITNTDNYGQVGVYDSDHVAYINTGGNTLWQDVGELQANTTYTLTVSGRVIQGASSAPVSYGLGLLNGTDLSGTILNTNATSVVGMNDWDGWPAGFSDISVSFTTGSVVSGHLIIALANTTDTYDRITQVGFTDVRLSATAVPEAASLIMIVPACVALLGRRKRV